VDGLQISIPQAILLLIVASGFGYWLMEKSKTGFKYGLAALFAFIILRTISFINANDRQQLIIYNVPQKQAMDIIDRRNYFFVGDSDLLADDFIRNFHLKPSRILHRIEPVEKMENYFQQEDLATYHGKTILSISETKQFIPLENKVSIDLLIISNNPKLYFTKLSKTFSIKHVVFDVHVLLGRSVTGKKDCDSLHIPYHDVGEEGAFVMKF
jgi:competence protein ComEC